MREPIEASIIIPAYNAARYIRDALDSALSQRGVICEVIVVNDGSTDDTRSLLEPYRDRIMYFENCTSRGVAAARNEGAASASGEWLAFLDADDLWDPLKLKKQIDRGKETGAALVYTDRINFGDLSRTAKLQSDAVKLYEGDVFEKLVLGNFITTSSVIIRKRFFQKLGGFSTELRTAEDWDLWLRYTSAGGKVALCREPLTKYRIHANQSSRKASQMLRDSKLVLKRAFSSKRGRTLSPFLRRRAYAGIWEVAASEFQQGHRALAIYAYIHSIAWWPASARPYKEILKTLFSFVKKWK